MTSDEPLAYQIGDQPFLSLTIYLDSRPLIPRPETEWWTEQLLSELGDGGRFARGGFRSATAREEAILQQENMPPSSSEVPTKPLTFLDLCAGSGAIGCAALKYLPDAEVYFGEIDPAHETTIMRNIRENHLDESRAHVCIGDLFEPFADMTFDIIAANPPYVPADRELDVSVTDYEPALALRSGPDGLDHIRRIALALKPHLAPSGQAWIECDSAHAEMVRALFRDEGFAAEIRTDQYEVPRILVVSWGHGRSSTESARAS